MLWIQAIRTSESTRMTATAMAAHATASIPPRPPTSGFTAATDMKPPHPPPPPLCTPESDAPPKKRKLEEVGFQVSPYYKIRAAIANLRRRFVQVCQATDFQKKDAALEILKEIKFVMELSKKMRLYISTAAEPVKPLDIPAARAATNKPAGEVLYGEKNQVPQVGQEKVPLEPVSSQEAVTNHTNHPVERVQGTYVFGGSPIGWNFRTWPVGKPVYYGPTKADWLARQAAK